MFTIFKSLFSKKKKPIEPTNEITKKFWYKDYNLLYSCDKIEAIKLLKSFGSLKSFKFGYLYDFDVKGDDIYIRVVTTGRLLKFMDYAILHHTRTNGQIGFDINQERRKGSAEELKFFTDEKIIKSLMEQI